MPDSVLIVKKRVPQASAVILTARIKDVDTEQPITATDIAAARLRVYDITQKPPVLIVPGTYVGAPEDYDGDNLNPSNIILPSLNTGYLSEDAEGYNFRLNLDGQAYLPDGGTVYRIEIRWTPAAEGAHIHYPPIFELTTIPVYSEQEQA
jgi:hypothetical protein